MPTLLALAGGKDSPSHPLDGKDIWQTLAEGQPSPNEDVLINVEAFRGAIRKGDWKLYKLALLPGKTELYNLASDPGETGNVAGRNPGIVQDLEARLVAYAKQQKPSGIRSKRNRPSWAPRERPCWTRFQTSMMAVCRARDLHCRRIDQRDGPHGCNGREDLLPARPACRTPSPQIHRWRPAAGPSHARTARHRAIFESFHV